MFNGHLLKVILGFCGVIIIGLISLVFIDSLKERDNQTTNAQNEMVETKATSQIPTNSKSPTTSTVKKTTPIKKTP
jgi:hypothetical protein